MKIRTLVLELAPAALLPWELNGLETERPIALDMRAMPGQGRMLMPAIHSYRTETDWDLSLEFNSIQFNSILVDSCTRQVIALARTTNNDMNTV